MPSSCIIGFILKKSRKYKKFKILKFHALTFIEIIQYLITYNYKLLSINNLRKKKYRYPEKTYIIQLLLMLFDYLHMNL